MSVLLRKIVSGGQTGVDRGALDAALAVSFPCGGWCPADRRAEDGSIPDRYPVMELRGAGYSERTRQNVLDSDGTLIIHFGELTGGTLKTAKLCDWHGKPVLLLDGLPADAAETRAQGGRVHQGEQNRSPQRGRPAREWACGRP